MISQSLYQALCDCVNELNSTALPSEVEGEYQQFNRPYVLVIHKPSGRGFYLDREYRHILNIKNCQEPKNPVEVERNCLCACIKPPAWVDQRNVEYQSEEFDSFWLY